MANTREGQEAGKHRDMGIKTAHGQDTEGHIPGSKQSEFNENHLRELRESEDNSELNRKDARGDSPGAGREDV